LSILSFIEKVINYLKLYNVRVIFSEDKKFKLKLENFLSKIVSLQGLLIATKEKDNQEIIAGKATSGMKLIMTKCFPL
jgi:hypothetical protein